MCMSMVFMVYHASKSSLNIITNKGIVKLREREGLRVDLGRSLKGHYGWWMVVYLSLMLYTKFGCHHHHHLPSTKSL